MAIKSVTKDNVLMGLVMYVTRVIVGQIRPKSLSLEIDNDITIPKVIRIDQKKGFVG
jgi:hypothetical protein